MRSQPMRRPSIRPPREDRPMAPARRLERAPNYAGSASGQPLAKDKPVRSRAYRQIVATLPCAHCFISGYSQAAHADEDKGLGTKTDDRTCYPACGPHDGKPGCHYLIGSTGTYPREERRAMEREYARRTRRAILAMGRWPRRLPPWDEGAAR